MARELGDLCYNIPNESIYGEFSKHSIYQLWKQFLHLKHNHVLDIGSGSGFTLSYFATFAQQVTGIEISKERVSLSLSVLQQLQLSIPWNIVHQDIMHMSNLPESCTHSFHFDKTFPLVLRQKIATLETQSSSIVCVATCHRDLYVDWTYQSSCTCTMRGSGQKMTMHIFVR